LCRRYVEDAGGGSGVGEEARVVDEGNGCVSVSRHEGCGMGGGSSREGSARLRDQWGWEARTAEVAAGLGEGKYAKETRRRSADEVGGKRGGVRDEGRYATKKSGCRQGSGL
jgi:hypothetical protein